ncbi:hypothetical protein [Gaoshiqia sediminis]|uniref:SH3 domain-containing protein n=1 Tax=Gaoshiqia sediminis TaxID=2986998 RepID=A0AA41Y3P1_9BACT|nr:hypothetical protein [Gaoshiqia sediminis]MCW0482871.1 hypothetical protein [Gaoshiqia sediminis]
MKPRIYFLMMLTLFSGLLLSCGQNQKTNNDSQKGVQIETVSKTPTIYNIEGEDIVIRVGPGGNFDKLINKKATEALGETHYAQVDYTVKVIIEDTNGDWSKIKVVEPDWLSSSHIGWIPTRNIIMGKNDENKELEKLDTNSYEILMTEHNAAVENFHVLIKFSDFDKDKIFDFVKKFRNENCTRNCNIMVYDTKSILPLIDKYPLQGKEYIELADHFVAMSSFDAPNLKSWYPYQDFQYKEYGGKNWKKEEIK